MTRFILSFFIFLFSFNFLYAEEQYDSTKIIDDYKKNMEGKKFSITSKTFRINSKEYSAFMLSSYDTVGKENYYKNTTVYICNSSNSKLSNCKSLNIYRLRTADNATIAVSKNYITFEMPTEYYSKHYLTLKENNGEFYLHKLTRSLYEEQPELLSNENVSKSFKIKMEDITIADLMPSRIPTPLINKYPSLKNNIYNAVSGFDGNAIDTAVSEFKIDKKDFTAIAIVANYNSGQAYSNTSGGWMVPAGDVTFICDGLGNNISNCRKGGTLIGPSEVLSIATKNGYITFGSFNCTSKFNDTNFYIWSKILEKIPDAKLLIYRTRLSKKMIKYFKSKLEKRGISLDRVIFSSKNYSPHFKAYSLVDISLDPYPFSGMSITIETALMGVPTITLVGEGMQSRGAGRINHIIGLDEFNASYGDEYIEKAVNLANDKSKLEKLRNELREKINASDLRQSAVEFTRDLENKYRKVWTDFINSP